MLYWGQLIVGFTALVKAHGGIIVEFNIEDILFSVKCK